jgi:hypothetical protein
LVLPDQGIETHRERSGAIYSLVMKEHRNRNTTYTDLSTVLRLNNPSQAENKRQNDSLDLVDPVIDHLMRSRALRSLIWGFIVGVLSLGLGIMVVVSFSGFKQEPGPVRVTILMIGVPCLLGYVPMFTAVAMLCSRRLR